MDISAFENFGIIAILGFGLVGFVAGFVKGTTGFAMPMVMISGLASVLSPELALAALIMPTLVSNVWQSFRQGLVAALGSARKHIIFLMMLLPGIAVGAQFVRALPPQLMFLVIGTLVTSFACIQLLGWQPKLQNAGKRLASVGIGAFAGILGGLSGMWGPPTVMYLTTLETPKHEQMRVQGVVYGLGSVVLALAHVKSGVLVGDGLRLSIAMVPPALIGLWVGFMVLDRVDQQIFKRMTLCVLIVAGLNLIRRGVFG
ncbi:MAG: sulfite exporter TauE/SafE family protein [Paracoccaceae bacterium]